MYRNVFALFLFIILPVQHSYAAYEVSNTGYAIQLDHYLELKTRYEKKNKTVIDLPSNIAETKLKDLSYDYKKRLVLLKNDDLSSFFSYHQDALQYLKYFLIRSYSWPKQRDSEQLTVQNAIDSEANFSILDLIISPKFLRLPNQKKYIKNYLTSKDFQKVEAWAKLNRNKEITKSIWEILGSNN